LEYSVFSGFKKKNGEKGKEIKKTKMPGYSRGIRKMIDYWSI
jgi:hypothetical protein